MLWNVKNTSILRRLISLFAIVFLLQTSFGFFHKHKEENLHFHAENLLTKDHTKSVRLDCSVCPFYYSTSHFNLSFNQFYIIQISNFQNIELREYAYLASILFGEKLGRAPPNFT